MHEETLIFTVKTNESSDHKLYFSENFRAAISIRDSKYQSERVSITLKTFSTSNDLKAEYIVESRITEGPDVNDFYTHKSNKIHHTDYAITRFNLRNINTEIQIIIVRVVDFEDEISVSTNGSSEDIEDHESFNYHVRSVHESFNRARERSSSDSSSNVEVGRVSRDPSDQLFATSGEIEFFSELSRTIFHGFKTKRWKSCSIGYASTFLFKIHKECVCDEFSVNIQKHLCIEIQDSDYNAYGFYVLQISEKENDSLKIVYEATKEREQEQTTLWEVEIHDYAKKVFEFQIIKIVYGWQRIALR